MRWHATPDDLMPLILSFAGRGAIHVLRHEALRECAALRLQRCARAVRRPELRDTARLRIWLNGAWRPARLSSCGGGGAFLLLVTTPCTVRVALLTHGHRWALRHERPRVGPRATARYDAG